MERLHNDWKLDIAKNLQALIASTFQIDVSVSEIYNSITNPPDLKMGHIAYPCFPLAKTLKKGPPQIASLLASQFKSDNTLLTAKSVGPYLNLTVDTNSLGRSIVEEILADNFFHLEITENTPKTMIEYSQPNTHKELHVGHMRNLALGNALIRLHKYIGFDILSATFPGDMGTHVAKCLWYLKNHNDEAVPTTRKGAWLGKMYTLATLKLEDEKDETKIEDNKRQLTKILKQIETKSGEYYDLWKETKEWSLELMREVYEWAGVSFDKWYFESEVDAKSLALVKEYYEKGIFIKDQGAIGIDLSDSDLGFCLLLKSDGNGLYATKDIELARRKFEENKIEKSIYVVDKRQALHFKQVFKTLEKMGFKQAKECFHLAYDYVELPDGAMSSRKGNIVPIQDLIDQMVSTIKNNYLNKYAGEWTPSQIDKTANMIARGAINYGMVRLDNNRKIVFEMNEWLKLDGESGPYIQYAHARIKSMCDKLGYKKNDVNWSLLTHESEIALMLMLSEFNHTAFISATTYRTVTMCSYLYDLSKLYNSFYAECPVNKAESEELKQARLHLSKAVSMVLAKGLELLGIEAPDRM